ncbi:MAG TPA: hypothetical protein VEL05_03100, partial [Candidatus Acidoferrum sp.]|nr:hypothetical protein [Candidatus Acidoferrum sp.]
QVRLWQLEPAPRSYAVHGSKEGEFRSPRGHDILYFEQDGGTVGVLDLRTGAIQLARTARPRARLAGDPTGTRLAYRDLERHVSFIELQGSVERRLPLTVEMVGAAIEFSPDGKTLAFPGWKGIYLVDVASLAARELPYPSGPIRDQTQLKVRRLQFSDDGRRIMSVGVDIALWDLASGRAIAIPRRQPGPPSYVVGSRDLAVIAEGGAAGGLWLLDRAKGSWRRLLSTEREVFPIAFSPDGTRVAAGTDQGQLRVWRVSDGARVEELVGHAGPIRRMEFADDGRRLVSAGVDGAVRLWDLGTGQELRAIRAHSGREVEWVGFRGTDIVSAGRDGMARIWPPVARSPGPVARLLDGLTSFRMDPGDN